ncbi:MAG: hypothetical protein A2540_00370 [Sulfurimonas sp. RIFOXYD2_FULL_37_8]|nr:MAG: hypothetical protein A2540_00370 [Sulfurimonas sp. RIFOXYD2_FULL_37_8]
MKIILLLLLNIYFLNAQIVIVTNKNTKIENLPKEIVQYLYLAKINKIDTVKLEPILSDDEALHDQFCNTILCKSQSQYNSYWARLVFTGKKSISKKLEWKEIVKKLQDTNTIAYIEKKDLRAEWKIVYEEN